MLILYSVLSNPSKEELIFLIIVYLITILFSHSREKSDKIKKLKRALLYLDDRFNLYEKMFDNEGVPNDNNIGGLTNYEFKWVVEDRANWRKIQKGMTQAEVRDIMAPMKEQIFSDSSGYEWKYENGNIYFDTDRKVKSWHINDCEDWKWEGVE